MVFPVHHLSVVKLLSCLLYFLLLITLIIIMTTIIRRSYYLTSPTPDTAFWPTLAPNDGNDRVESQLMFMDTYIPKVLSVVGKRRRIDEGTSDRGSAGGRISRGVTVEEGENDDDSFPLKTIVCVGGCSIDNVLYGNTDKQLFRDCPINRCQLTQNRSFVKTADVLMFASLQLADIQLYLPKPVHQLWMSIMLEAPADSKPWFDPAAFKGGLLNWTATYRRDSTIHLGYGHFKRIPPAVPQNSGPASRTFVNYAVNKTKKVAMLIGHCDAPSTGRLNYAHHLQNYTSVDIYGSCGPFKCPGKDQQYPAANRLVCVRWLAKQYKFYLAFENANCKHYITEKFFENGLRHDWVPVVMGASVHDLATGPIPPHSYIHVDDFSGPQELASYLNYLDSNDTAYSEYLAWKGHWRATNERFWCRLCMALYLQEETRYTHWYSDYERWWDGECRNRTGYSGVRSRLTWPGHDAAS